MDCFKVVGLVAIALHWRPYIQNGSVMSLATIFGAFCGKMVLLHGSQRCQLGRGCPAHIEHTFVPGKCRMGQPGIRGARSSSQPPTPRLSAGDLEDPTGPFKLLARSGDYSMIALTLDSTGRLGPEKYLKVALVQFIQSCVGIFSEATGTDYDHWLDDPVLLRVFQDVFAPDLQVLGVLCSLRPWKRKVPDPYLSSSCAPIRQLIRGSLRSWHVQAPEDMRLMSHSQLHAPVEEADWRVHLFGYEPSDAQVDRADAPRVPPAASSVPASDRDPVEKKNGGKAVIPPSSSAPPSSAAAPPAQPSEDDIRLGTAMEPWKRNKNLLKKKSSRQFDRMKRKRR